MIIRVGGSTDMDDENGQQGGCGRINRVRTGKVNWI